MNLFVKQISLAGIDETCVCLFDIPVSIKCFSFLNREVEFFISKR